MNSFTYLSLFALILPMAIHSIDFAVKENNSSNYCLILQANITGTLKYLNMANSTSTVEFSVPEGGATTMDRDVSQCGQKLEKLRFDFVPTMKPPVSGIDVQNQWNIQMDFIKKDEEQFVLQNYSLTVHYYPNMNASEQNVTIEHVYYKQENFHPEWSAAKPNGFVCSQNQLPLNMVDTSIQFNKLKVLAFVSQNESEFKQEQIFEQCSLDTRTSDVVPIIVGACLAGLVIVVLVAYLIGRARAKRQGYASV